MATQETIKQMRVSENGPLRDLEDTTARAGVSALQTALASLRSALDTLMGTDDITDQIDTYNEIKDFLDGFNVNDPNLSSQLSLLNTQVNDLLTAMQNKVSTSALNIAVANLRSLINGKVDAVNGKGLSTNDYTDTEKTKLAGIAEGAQVNVINGIKKHDGTPLTPQNGIVTLPEQTEVFAGSGTYEQAVTRSQTDTGSFMWMLVDSIGSNTIRKPIFHIGNGVFVDMAGAVVEIGEVPNAPTFTMSDETSTPNEFPVGGGTVAISAGTGETIYYTTDGTTPTTSSTEYDEPIQVTEDMTIKAIAVNQYGSSEVASETFTIAVDHKFQFKIRLTDNTKIEYVPVVLSNVYNMTIDWGDESEVETYAKTAANKDLSHDYTGKVGSGANNNEFVITLRGSAIPKLAFASTGASSIYYNRASLVGIIENTLECDTQFIGNNVYSGGFTNCTNLESISADALQNNTYNIVNFQNTKLTTIPDGLLSHLVKLSVVSFSVTGLFNGTGIVLTASQFAELKTTLAKVTTLHELFAGVTAANTIPNDLLDDVPSGLASVTSAFQSNNLTGDAYVLYLALKDKIASGGTTAACFSSTSLSNRNQVPNAWGGTGG